MLNSPCDGNCRLDYKIKICMGCFRTMDEILGWINYSEEQKNEVYNLIEQRKKELNNGSKNLI